MKIKIALITFLFSTSCFAQYQVGDVITDKYIVEEKNVVKSILHEIPLPKGSWTVARIYDYYSRPTGVSQHGSEVPMRGISLASIEGSKLNGYLYIVTNMSGKAYKWIDEPCKKSNVIYSNNYGTDIYNQKCLTINLNTFLEGSSKVQSELRNFFADRKVQYPAIMLNTTYSEYSTSGNYVTVSNYIFPSNFGMSISGGTPLASNPWSAELYKSDPKKVEFISQLTKWSEEYAKLIMKSGSNNPTETIAPFNSK
jgi:hypothetical protein